MMATFMKIRSPPSFRNEATKLFLQCKQKFPTEVTSVGSLSKKFSSIGIGNFNTIIHGNHGAVMKQQQLYHLSVLQRREFSTSNENSVSNKSNNPFFEFRDNSSRQDRSTNRVGRSWSVKELRRKSYDDLQKLWYVFLNVECQHVIIQ